MKLFKRISKNKIKSKITQLETKQKEILESISIKNTMQEKAHVFTEEQKLKFAIKTLKELL